MKLFRDKKRAPSPAVEAELREHWLQGSRTERTDILQKDAVAGAAGSLLEATLYSVGLALLVSLTWLSFNTAIALQKTDAFAAPMLFIAAFVGVAGLIGLVWLIAKRLRAVWHHLEIRRVLSAIEVATDHAYDAWIEKNALERVASRGGLESNGEDHQERGGLGL